MVDINPAWIALIGTVFGGVGLKFTEAWLNRSTKHDDAAKIFRDEQRIEITGLRTELDKVEREANEWRDKYWELRGEYAKVQAEYTKVTGELTAAIEKIKQRIEQRDDMPKGDLPK